MYELGQYSEQGHKAVGEKVVASGCELLITVGDLAKNIAQGAMNAGMNSKQIRICGSNREAIMQLQNMLNERDAVLVKGSRGVHMEEIVAELMR